MEFGFDVKQGGFEDTSIKRAPKRIIICCDGTWQSSVTNTTNVPSNVTRLARYLTKAGKDDSGTEWQQVVYYDAGIGTGVADLEAKRQGGTGSGFVGNVIEAYNFIVLNYNLGDQIFCIGFSRGAYTARAVAGLVTDIGVIRPRDMQDFPELYRIYQNHTDSHTFRKSEEFQEWVEGKRAFDPSQKSVPKEYRQSPFSWEKRPHGAAPESTRWVEAVAVFDTVGSLGIPKVEGFFAGILTSILGKVMEIEKFGFHNVALSPFIKNAYHALALDEHRKPFGPTLWHFPADGVAETPKPKGSSSELKQKYEQLRDDIDATKAARSDAWQDYIDAAMYEELKDTNSKLLQVWFPGVHINIGGGNDDLLKVKESDFEQIAMITLNWMVEQLKHHLDFEINFATLSLTDRFLLMRPAVEELFKSNQKTNWLVKRTEALLAQESSTDPWNDGNFTRRLLLVADALKGWATGPINDSFVGEMKAAGSQDRSPGQYEKTLLSSGETVRLGKTNEYMHPTVQHRIEKLAGEYNPAALKGYKRQQSKDSNGQVTYEWVKGNTRVPEYKLAGMDSLERYLVASPQARTFLGRLDKEYGIDSWEAKDLDAAPSTQPAQTGFQPENAGF